MPPRVLVGPNSGQQAGAEHDSDHLTPNNNHEQKSAPQESSGVSSPLESKEVQREKDTGDESLKPSGGNRRPHDSDHELDSEGELHRRSDRAGCSRKPHDSDNEMDSEGHLKPVHKSHHSKLDQHSEASTPCPDNDSESVQEMDAVCTWRGWW